MFLWEVRKPEPAISRVLSSTTIHLGQPSPTASSNLPGSPFGTDGTGEPVYSPIWSCSGRGLPCRELLPVARCALTAPFHPYQPRLAVYFLWHFPWAHAPQALPGALSEGARTFLHSELQRLSGQLRLSRRRVYCICPSQSANSSIPYLTTNLSIFIMTTKLSIRTQ